MKISLKQTAVIYLFLVGELLTLRGLFHSILKTPIGWNGTTDFDLFIPCTVAFFLFFSSLNHFEKMTWTVKKGTAFLHFCFVLALVGYTAVSPSRNMTVWFLMLGGVVLSGISVFISPGYFLRNKNKWVLIPCTLIALSVTVYQHHFQLLWPLLGGLTGSWVCKLLAWSPIPQASCELSTNLKSLAPQIFLKAQYYRATLAPGCVGLDGQLLNLLVFLTQLSLVPAVRWLRAGILLVLGALGIFVMNVLRIVVLFGVGQWSMTTDFSLWAMEAVRFAFHAHLGWVLYSLLLLFLYQRINIQRNLKTPAASRLGINTSSSLETSSRLILAQRILRKLRTSWVFPSEMSLNR